MRNFSKQSILTNGNLALSIAPALTPKGLENNPQFFKGFVLEPQVIARGLLVLADITATRYFNYTPVAERDPVLTAQGDRLRCECFSACNGVYARLDLLNDGFYGEIGYGTTNVDIGKTLRSSLSHIKKEDKLHLLIGEDGLDVRHLKNIDNIILSINPIFERQVEMPNRWIRALGNTAGIHKKMLFAFSVKGILAKQFIAKLPSATSKEQSGFLTYSPSGIKILPHYSKNSVFISGIHRLSALKRVMTDVKSISFYAPTSEDTKEGVAIEVSLSNARITITLTAKSYQGYSGEGALLSSLAQQEVLDDADRILTNLSFNSVVATNKINLDKKSLENALAVLAVSGKLGFDMFENSYFHRELPHDPDRVLKDNPRLISAQRLVETQNVEYISENQFMVHSLDNDYRVIYSADENTRKCTCKWYLSHQNSRGPCKHILAVELWRDKK